jgi:hypothetical protein
MIKKIFTGVFLVSIVFAGLIALNNSDNIDAEKMALIQQEKMALVQDARSRADAAVKKRAEEFKAFIDGRKGGAKPFSADVIGWKGSWQALKCQLPGMEDDCHKQYIAQKFSAHIFTPEDFRNAMNRSIAGGVKDIEGIENQLAVSLRKVILGRSLTPPELPLAEAEFKSSIEAARSASNDAVLKEAGGLVVTEVVTQITTQVLVRIGVTAGILTVAGANSWWTLGGSLVIGVAVAAIWDFFTHPADDIERAMIIELDKISSSGSAAIRVELTRKVAARSQLWETTVKEAR